MPHSLKSQALKIEALKRSIFNAANLSALGAVFLSYSMGSLLGTLIFVFATIIGSYNKYSSVMNGSNAGARQSILQILKAPSITAQILMAAALINFLKTSYDGFTTFPEEFVYFLFLALAWFFGFLGDDALRRNDKTNFTADILSKERPIWLKTFIYVTRNPVFYYTLTNMFFAVAILLTGEGRSSEENKFILEILTVFLIFTALIGVAYALWKGMQMIKGKITPAQTNDGVINWLTVLINLEMGAMAIIQGLYWVAFAQIFYITANIVCLYETRHALHKEHS